MILYIFESIAMIMITYSTGITKDNIIILFDLRIKTYFAVIVTGKSVDFFNSPRKG
jgi:hypothetical protein